MKLPPRIHLNRFVVLGRFSYTKSQNPTISSQSLLGELLTNSVELSSYIIIDVSWRAIVYIVQM